MEQDRRISQGGRIASTVQLFAKILHNGSERGSVTLANQIHFSSRVQLYLGVTLTCV